MISNEFIAKAKQLTNKEELLALAKEEGVVLTEKMADMFLPTDNKAGEKTDAAVIKELSDDELENVSGGTCYGDGWDGTSRPIVLKDNNCSLWTMAHDYWGHCDVICSNCWYYSGRRDGKTITDVSAWCTHPSRIEGHDVIND